MTRRRHRAPGATPYWEPFDEPSFRAHVRVLDRTATHIRYCDHCGRPHERWERAGDPTGNWCGRCHPTRQVGTADNPAPYSPLCATCGHETRRVRHDTVQLRGEAYTPAQGVMWTRCHCRALYTVETT
jgi:hypothetical protein